MSLDRTIDALLPDWPNLGPSVRAEVLSHCIAFVRSQLALAPFHIRAGFRVLFAAYAVYALLTAGPFANRAARAAALTAFSTLPLPLVAGLERLLRAATMLAYFDDPAVLGAMGEDTPRARQQAYRVIRNQTTEPAL